MLLRLLRSFPSIALHIPTAHNSACNSHVYQKNIKFGLKYRLSMRIFVYGLCFQVMANAAQVFNTKKETVRDKPQVHRITCTFI